MSAALVPASGCRVSPPTGTRLREHDRGQWWAGPGWTSSGAALMLPRDCVTTFPRWCQLQHPPASPSCLLALEVSSTTSCRRRPHRGLLPASLGGGLARVQPPAIITCLAVCASSAKTTCPQCTARSRRLPSPSSSNSPKLIGTPPSDCSRATTGTHKMQSTRKYFSILLVIYKRRGVATVFLVLSLLLR